MQNYNYYTLILITALVSGCGGTSSYKKDSHVRETIIELSTKETSYSSLKEIEYEQLDYNAGESVFIDEESPVYVFQTGKSYFKAYKLPEFSSAYQIRISSSLSMEESDGETREATIFYPVFLFLDKDQKISRSEIPVQRVQFYPYDQPGIDGYIDVTDEDSNDRYMIIHSENTVLGKGQNINEAPSLGAVPMAGGGMIMVYNEGGKYSIPYDVIGSLWLKLEKN